MGTKFSRFLCGFRVNDNDNNSESASVEVLFRAIRNFDKTEKGLESFRNLLEAHTDMVNEQDRYGNTPLHWAAKYGKINISTILIEQGAQVDVRNQQGRTPLHNAAEFGKDPMAQLLLENGARINGKNEEGRTALHFAAEFNRADMLILLLEGGADIFAIDRHNIRPLSLLASKSTRKAVFIDNEFSLHALERQNYALWFCIIQLTGNDVGIEDEKITTKVLSYIHSHPHLVIVKDSDGRGAMDLSKLDKKAKRTLYLDTTFSLPALEAHNNELWFHLIQVDDVEGITGKVLYYSRNYPHMAYVKDADGRVAMDVARKENKRAIQSVLLWHGRYRLVENRPEHTSSTCFVYRAVDEATVHPESGAPMPVAVKLMRRKDQFLREMETRRCKFSMDYIVNVVATYPKYGNICEKPEGMISVDSSADLASQMDQPPDAKGDARRSLNAVTTLESIGDDDSSLDADSEIRRGLVSQERHHDHKGEVDAIDRAVIKRWPDFVQLEGEISENSGGGTQSKSAGTISSSATSQGLLTKAQAEKFFFVVMPHAERNMYVALKQERWAGKDLDQVRHGFAQLVRCVQHMHTRGNVIHGDVKPLNMVRNGAQWLLVDLDSASRIGHEPVGHKYSSAYVPPEAVYTNEEEQIACVRSVEPPVSLLKILHQQQQHQREHDSGETSSSASSSSSSSSSHQQPELPYTLLTADPSFDVWSLGCVLYQLCHPDVKPLFQGSQEDNLTDDRSEEDNLWVLAEWSSERKTKKLLRIADPLARNLLSQMLLKDPRQRPSLDRVLAHPFLSGKKVARLVGEKARYDVFLSYRVASDTHHTKMLYDLLCGMGLKVWWDRECLEHGLDWKEGFCAGLMNSRAFVCILSRDAINHRENPRQSYESLAEDSPCDNVLLEHRLALELLGLGLIEKIFPLMIGDLNHSTQNYSNFFDSGCLPNAPDVTVRSVENDLRFHMERQALGTPLEAGRSVSSIMKTILSSHGAFIEGDGPSAFAKAAATIAAMLSGASEEEEDDELSDDDRPTIDDTP